MGVTMKVEQRQRTNVEWNPIGPERLVTRALGKVLFELDCKSVVELYKAYLGEKSNDLLGNAILFSICMRMDGCDPVVSRILSVNENEQSMTFSIEIPEGSYGRFMKSDSQRQRVS